jgi:hypothetical protein
MRIPVAVSLSLFFVSPASADLDGHLLHSMCKKNIEFVAGYVAGVADKANNDAEFVAALMADKLDEKKTGPENWKDGLKAIREVQPFCIHKGKDAKLADMVQFVCKSLEVLPDARKHRAAVLTADVLKVKYPCKDERPPEGFSPEKFINR